MTDSEHSNEGSQQEMPFAMVQGEPVIQVPQDLYIPPDALEVILDAFEGPLDLLLYLIKRQNLDICDIPLADITRQYMEYIDLMESMRLELAAEYLVMAAMLAEIKSRMLLPRQSLNEDGEEEDPRAELIRRLQEYEQFKQAAEEIDELPRLERDLFLVEADIKSIPRQRVEPQVTMQELMVAFSEVLNRVDMFTHHHIQREQLSVRERMSQLLTSLQKKQFSDFHGLFAPHEGRLGVVVTFLAVLELIKEALIDLIQAEPYGPIHLKLVSGEASEEPTAT